MRGPEVSVIRSLETAKRYFQRENNKWLVVIGLEAEGIKSSCVVDFEG